LYIVCVNFKKSCLFILYAILNVCKQAARRNFSSIQINFLHFCYIMHSQMILNTFSVILFKMVLALFVLEQYRWKIPPKWPYCYKICLFKICIQKWMHKSQRFDAKLWLKYKFESNSPWSVCSLYLKSITLTLFIYMSADNELLLCLFFVSSSVIMYIVTNL